MRKSKSTEQVKKESIHSAGVQLHITTYQRIEFLGQSVSRTRAAANPLLSASSTASEDLQHI